MFYKWEIADQDVLMEVKQLECKHYIMMTKMMKRVTIYLIFRKFRKKCYRENSFRFFWRRYIFYFYIGKYNHNINNLAGALYNPEIYEKITNGEKLESLVIPLIRDLDNLMLFLLIDYMFETVFIFVKNRLEL